MKNVLSTLAAAMIASASFAGLALAEGGRDEGVSKAGATSKIDRVKTGSTHHERADRSDNPRAVFEPNYGDSH